MVKKMGGIKGLFKGIPFVFYAVSPFLLLAFHNLLALFSAGQISFTYVKNQFFILGRSPWGRDSNIKRDGGSSLYSLGVKKTVVVPLRLFSLKMSTAGAFAALSRVGKR